MNKSDLVRLVYERMDKKITMKDLDLIVDAVFDTISERLQAGAEVHLADFGTFSLAKFAVKPAEVHTRRVKV